ncbi:hypothetical protein CTZ23_14260 [Acinetobacter indicus]|nr:hypothetical protein CTZ23_14260 [Acinetobacter indicus]
MVRGIANSKIGFGDLILLLRYFFKLKVSTHPKNNGYLHYMVEISSSSKSSSPPYNSTKVGI